jgi:FkbM family methyltransferase
MTNKINIPAHNLGGYQVPESVKDGICVDIGSNIGCFFEKFSNIFSKIHFYEPYKDCYAVCLDKSKNHSNIIGFNEAVLDKKRESVEVLHHFNHDAGSNAIKSESINEHWDANDIIGTCPSVDLETVLERVGGKIDYLKCDCETSEYYVFVGKDLTNIGYIALELHWQMGEQKFFETLNHILKTHNLISGNPFYAIECNHELFFQNKNL